MSDDEAFARLIFIGVTLLGRQEDEVWLMRMGALLDQIEIWRQYQGISAPEAEMFIDDIIPDWI